MAIDPARLLLLAAIRDHGGVTRAAQRTGRTAPAVSQQLAKLETEVGAPLVERQPHGARLTPLGRQLVVRADDVAEALRQAQDTAADYLDRHRNRLRLGAFPTAGLALLPDALTALRHRNPDAELSVVDLGPVEGAALVAEHDLDLALVGEYAEPITAPPGVDLLPLIKDPIHAVVPLEHPLAAGDQDVRLRDFADEAWASAPVELPNRRQLDEQAAAQHFTPHVPFESESYAVAQALVSAGVAVSFIPRLAISDTPGTRHRRLAEPELFRRIHAAVPADTSHAPLTAVFLELLRNVCAEREAS